MCMSHSCQTCFCVGLLLLIHRKLPVGIVSVPWTRPLILVTCAAMRIQMQQQGSSGKLPDIYFPDPPLKLNHFDMN